MADKNVLELPEEFDRLLREELSVEPSSSFAVRVRARAAEQQRTPWWRARWMPAVGSFATVASITVALIVPAVARWTSIPGPPVRPVPPPMESVSLQQPRLDPAALAVPVMAPSRVSARRASARQGGELERPLIIVDRRDNAALERFVSMVQQGRLGEEAFAHRARPATVAIKDTLLPIVVAPVAVSSIPAAGVLSLETERK